MRGDPRDMPSMLIEWFEFATESAWIASVYELGFVVEILNFNEPVGAFTTQKLSFAHAFDSRVSRPPGVAPARPSTVENRARKMA